MTQTKFFRWTLLLCLSGATSPLAAQGVGEKAKKVEQMQVLKTDGKVLRITVDGKEQQIPWVINPSLRPDVFETSGEEVVFRSKIDTIRFNVAKEGCYDFGFSRFFVGIIFYLREVLLTLHYEKRLFEHASQPRVAGSDIRLLSHLWSRTNLSRDSYQSG